MNWLIFLFAIELGFAPSYGSLNITEGVPDFMLTEQVGYVQMDAEVEMFDFLFVGGSMKTYIQGTSDITNYHPFELDSFFNAGLRFGDMELGWRHLCLHPVRPLEIVYNSNTSTDASYDEYYIRMEIKR